MEINMKKYVITTHFIIGDKEDPIEYIDNWLKETATQYKSPSEQFDINEHITVMRVNDVTSKKEKLSASALLYNSAVQQATRFMDAMEKKYQQNHPCPQCGSHNVHIEINGLGGGNVDGSEWCDDCGWKKDTNTFKKV
jgi:ribosomal protein L37AE/L43A